MSSTALESICAASSDRVCRRYIFTAAAAANSETAGS